MNRQTYLVLGFIIFTVLSILAFDLYVLKFGKFWEKDKISNQKIASTSTPIPAPKALDQTLIKNKLLNLLPQIFNSSYLPLSDANLILEADQTTQDSFKVRWESKTATAGGRLTVSPDDDFSSVYLSLVLIRNQVLNPNLAKTLLTQIFSLTPKTDFKCAAIKSGTYCENLWEENLIKKGLGVLGPMKLTNNQTGLVVFFCQFTSTSKQYVWQSCTTEFAKTGVR